MLASMLLFVGLGNPGARYAGNRHNFGFMALDAIARAHSFAPWRKKFRGEAAEGAIAGEKTLLLKPQTYYNESGGAVREAASFYKIAPERIVVFHDEIDLAPGRLRVKQGGGAAGNNGVRSITGQIGDAFRRVRLGVGHPGQAELVQGYVLSDFHKADADWVDALLTALARAAPMLAAGDDEKFQGEVMRLAPAAKADPRKAPRDGAES
jgi:PTH1 family peptidyl-tRNA hydrolase